jgi:hypothetical protein
MNANSIFQSSFKRFVNFLQGIIKASANKYQVLKERSNSLVLQIY